MLNNLLESDARTARRTGGGVVSLLLHSAAVVALVVATASAGEQVAEATPERIKFVPVVQDDPPPAPEQAPPPDVVAVAPVPEGFQTLAAPDIIPLDIPEIDLTRAVTNEADFVPVGTPGGRRDGAGDGPPPLLRGDTPFRVTEVEKPAAMAGPASIAYPEVLRSAELEGTVMASFVVDTSGYADMSTFTVLSSDHPLFTNAVRRALTRIHYRPAEVGGRKVKQLVQQPFQFRLHR